MAEEKKIEGFSNIKFTASGLLLEAKLKTGVPLKITRAVIGTGYLDDGEDVANLTALKSEIESHQTGVTSSSATVDITNVSVVAAGMTNLRLKIKNGDTPFYLREIGIMAQDPDLGEILYLYTNCGNGAQAFPVFDGSNHVYRTIDFLNIISNASDINVNVTLNNEVTRDDFETHKTATVLDHPNGCVTTEKIADSSVTGIKIKDSAITLAKLNNDIHTKFDGLEKAIQKINSTKKIDLEYSIGQGHDGYIIVVKPKVNYIARKDVSGIATYPLQSIDKCYMYICYNYDSDRISLVCGTTVSGRGPQPPDNDIFSAEISSSSDCGNFEYHRLIQKDDNGDIVAVM